MQRYLLLTAALAATVGNLSAGAISQGVVQTKINLSGSNITLANEGGWTERNYDKNLYDSATLSSVAPAPYTGYSQFAATGGTIVDGGVTFNVLNDGCGSTNTGTGLANSCSSGTSNVNNYWAAAAAGSSSTFTIPIGILGVTDVWTMLENTFGMQNANNTNIIFNWGSTATGAITNSLTVNLNNSGALNTTGGQIQSGIQCSAAGVGTSTCNTAAEGSPSSTPAMGVGGGVTEYSDQVFTAGYNNTLPGTTIYGGSTAGNVTLNDQGFFLNGLNTGLYLVNIQIVEKSGGAGVSQTDISAVTVDSAPEPGSVWLGITGVVLIAGFSWMRRRQVV